MSQAQSRQARPQTARVIIDLSAADRDPLIGALTRATPATGSDAKSINHLRGILAAAMISQPETPSMNPQKNFIVLGRETGTIHFQGNQAECDRYRYNMLKIPGAEATSVEPLQNLKANPGV